MRINPAKTQKEPTYQVVLDALALTTCYHAFLITIDVPEIYMHQFWFTINKHDSSYRFKIGKKRFTLNVEVFREIFQISPKLPNQEFDALPLDEEIISLIKELGHKGDIKSITEVRSLLPEVMTNQKMRNSPAYKTYLAYATGAATPKKARKFKKPSSPSKKRTLVTVEEEEPEPAKKYNKALATTDRSKGIDLLSQAALLEEAQVKKGLKRSRRETTMHQAGGSGDGTGFKLSNDDREQADDERTDFENQETNDDDEESDNEFVHTPEEYVPTNDEVNYETKDVDDEEYERISEEVYGDVNVEQTQEQTTGVQEESGQEGIGGQITDLEKDVKKLKNVNNSTTVISTIKSEVPNAVKEYLGSSLDDALYKVIQKHLADIFKEHSVLAKIVERLKQ
ncbi:hypothetical protein Tco_0668211 [Tanacetum coccineum]